MNWINQIKPVLDLLNGLVSPFLAITVAYIAYQQWKTNDRKEKRESRSIKISIYKMVKSHLNYIDSTREIRRDLYEDFRLVASEADFIFPKEVIEFLDNIDSYSMQWVIGKECIESAGPNTDRASLTKTEQDMEKYIDFLQESHCKLYEVFNLHINEKKA